MQLLGERGVVELHGRNVDGDFERRFPGRRLAAGLLSTQSPIGRMAPISSAIGMKTPGDISPRDGFFQRNNASNPTTLPRLISSCG